VTQQSLKVGFVVAYKKIVEERFYPYLYNVDLGVGPSHHQPNCRDDVMLVQYLLRRVYEKAQEAQPPLNPNAGSAWCSGQLVSITQLKVDGNWGTQTQSAIEQFQLELQKRGINIAADGCVDPEKEGHSTLAFSKTSQTISWLNKYFWMLWSLLAPNVAHDPECPRELKRSLLHARRV
jgi:hypothetical protein